MKAAVLRRVGVGLVSGVDDRPFDRGLEPDLLFEEVRPLADLKPGVATKPLLRLVPDLARTAEICRVIR